MSSSFPNIDPAPERVPLSVDPGIPLGDESIGAMIKKFTDYSDQANKLSIRYAAHEECWKQAISELRSMQSKSISSHGTQN